MIIPYFASTWLHAFQLAPEYIVGRPHPLHNSTNWQLTGKGAINLNEYGQNAV
jgi:hypothetical protein